MDNHHDNNTLFHKLPKLELHAHLSGSVTQTQLKTMCPEFQTFHMLQDVTTSNTTTTNNNNNNNHSTRMSHCFSYFTAVAKVITDLDKLRTVTQHVLREFQKDATVYLELRTTPKSFTSSSSSGSIKREYVQVILECAQEIDWTLLPNNHNELQHNRSLPSMMIRLLLSIDRGRIHSIHDAKEQIQDVLYLASEFPNFVVGVDISGNPQVDSIQPFLLPALKQTVEEEIEEKEGTKGEVAGLLFGKLPITWHLGEHDDIEEIDRVLDCVDVLNIRRLGHVCFLSKEQTERVVNLQLSNGLDRNVGRKGLSNDDDERVEQHQQQKQQQPPEVPKPMGIGVELCPSSNFVTRNLSSMDQHHFRNFFDKGLCKVCICTDDVGLFSCTLTSEIKVVADTFQLTHREMRMLQMNALDTCFLREEEWKEKLRQRINEAYCLCS